MPANFTSGWLGNGERAWHGMGVVTDGTLPAREAFETADALFTVEKRELSYPVVTYRDNDYGNIIASGNAPAGVYGVVRTDTQALLGVVSKQYEIVQNDSLLRMAEFIREEVDMDSVVVLADGGKVAFTATLRGAETDIVPGDTIKRRLVGYLGHDGKTGCGAIFTNVRVVCCNTLAAALNSNNKVSVQHKGGANANFDALISSIDVARQTFAQEADLMREFARVSMGENVFNEYLDEVYQIEEGQKFRKRDKLNRAFRYGMGAEYAPMSVWNAVNAVTEVETSTRNQTAAGARRQFARANFGVGLQISNRAIEVATAYLSAV